MRPGLEMLNKAGELIATLLALAAATAAGALLLAISATGTITLPDILARVALPATIALLVLLVIAAALRWRRLMVGIGLGFWTGAIATAGLELVREIGFRVFDSMPGDLPMLMGVNITGQIMQGPNITSDIAGWSFHVWNGAMFGIIYALLLGGFPRHRRRSTWGAAGLCALYGVLLGTGFLLSPETTITGAGIFGVLIGAKFAVTVYLAHLLFGAIVGLLVHRFGRNLDPLWTPAFDLARHMMGQPTAQTVPAGPAAQHHRRL